MAKRKALTQKLRFEVFKRDSFKCQYCGQCAPDVVLNVDHIDPVANGGGNEIENLVTSCFACNSGKSDRQLSDDTIVAKSRSQLQDLQERREQIEMMLKWKKGLLSVDNEAVQAVCEFWTECIPTSTLTESGKACVKKLLTKWSLEQVLDAVRKSCAFYLKTDERGQITNASIDVAFSKIGGICCVDARAQEDPNAEELYRIRGLLRHRCNYWHGAYNSQCLDALNRGLDAGLSLDVMSKLAGTRSTFGSFLSELDAIIDSITEGDGDGR
jgi:hypothetical protein